MVRLFVCDCISMGCLTLRFPTLPFCVFLSSVVHATYPIHIIFIGLVIITVYGEEQF